MGQTILTSKQLDFLECVQQESSVAESFYLTGGTALAEFYLHHRLSEDIDLFTEKEEVDISAVETFLKKIGRKLGITQIKRSQFLGLVSFTLVYGDSETLKVDFNYYPFPRIDQGIMYQNIVVDSIYDIAVNKLHTLFMKPRSRDYIDLYFIIREKNYPLNKLVINAKIKFDWHIDRANLASQFMRVSDLKPKEPPQMLIGFDRKEMEEFYLKLAKSLEGEIFA
jgi:predicted nucleotidyltransferase component of viral defense system